MAKDKKDGGFSKSVIIAIMTFIILFTIAVMIVFVITGGIEPATLIISVFGFCGCEFGILGWIKTEKERKDAKKDAEEQRLRERNTEKE